MKKHIHLPANSSELFKLRAGDSVLITGTVYTARDAAHAKLSALIESGLPLPFPTNQAAIYYVGPTPAPEGAAIGSAGPTTASRCDKYTPTLIENGINVLIGKGKRSETVKNALVKYGAVYFAVTGGAGALLSQCVKSSKVIAFEELGTEAIRELYVENFPAVVINDCHGGDYYTSARQQYLESLN